MDFSLSYTTILYVVGLAVVAAAIAGVIPALRATGRWKQAVLKDLGSRSAPRLGRVWTAIVALQVGLSVAALPAAFEFGWWSLRSAVLGPGFAAGQFWTARLVFDAPLAGEPGRSARFAALRAQFARRVATEAGVSAVSLSGFTPTAEPIVRVEVDEPGQSSRQVRIPIRVNRVDDTFFETFNVPLLTGRGFSGADIEANRATVLVNRTFVDRVLATGNALGRRVRMRRASEESALEAAPEPWMDIVGVVADLRANGTGGPALYRPLSPNAPSEAGPAGEVGAIRGNQPQTQAVSLTIRTSGAVSSGSQDLAHRLQVITTALDPGLRLDRLRTMRDIYEEQIVGDILGGSAIVAVMIGILLVSVAGVYTLLSFTVTQRHREIAIRSALGASPLRLLAGIFRRVLAPIMAGAAAGGLVALFLNRFLLVIFMANVGSRPLPWILPAAALFAVVLAILVLAGPARRAIGLHPTEALREG
jgi:hypothetical protein